MLPGGWGGTEFDGVGGPLTVVGGVSGPHAPESN